MDGIAYFAANDYFTNRDLVRTDAFPGVVAFNVNTYQVVRHYDFSYTYDSSPLVYSTTDGTPLVIAHEYQNAETVAMNRDTGQIAWTSRQSTGRILLRILLV